MLTHPCRLQSRSSLSCFASVQPFARPYFVLLTNVSFADTNLRLFLRSCFASTFSLFFSHSSILLIFPLPQNSLTDSIGFSLSRTRLAVLLAACNSGPYESALIPHVNRIDIKKIYSIPFVTCSPSAYFIVQSFRKRIYKRPPNLHFRNRTRLHIHCQ